MKRKIKHTYITGIFLIFCFVFVPSGFAADTCMFTTTADDIPPLIVLLLDNGAEMEQIVWHSSYDNSVDYTPTGMADQRDPCYQPESGDLELINITETKGTLTLDPITPLPASAGYLELSNIIPKVTDGTLTLTNIVNTPDTLTVQTWSAGYGMLLFWNDPLYLDGTFTNGDLITSTKGGAAEVDHMDVYSTYSVLYYYGQTSNFVPSTIDIDTVVGPSGKAIIIAATDVPLVDGEALATSEAGVGTVNGEQIDNLVHLNPTGTTSTFTVDEFFFGNTSLSFNQVVAVTQTAFQDEIITDDSGGSATLNGTLVDGSTLSYYDPTINFTVGDVVRGETSGAYGTISSIVPPETKLFEAGETITGTTSGASATVIGTLVDGYKLNFGSLDPADAFSENETVTGQTSGATATINTGGIYRDAPTYFLDNEIITSASGSATVNGVLYGASEDLLDYDALTSDFALGEVVTGATSEAYATITGIQEISFLEGETITGSTSGSATVSGTLIGSWLYYNSLTNAFTGGDIVTGATSEAYGTIDNISYEPNGFFNENGYAIQKSGGKNYLYPILDDLTLDTANDLKADSGNTWIINGKTVSLPATPSTTKVDGIIDKAEIFRYSANYLNWIFYSGLYVGNGSDLPDKSRFYYAKKAIFSVARLTANKADFGIYNFTATTSGASRVQPLGLVVSTPLAANPANNTLDTNFVNNINNMGTVNYSPLAEGLASVGGYYASSASGVVGQYCQKLFTLVISPGVSSEDQAIGSSSQPTVFADYDGDGGGTGIDPGTVTISSIDYTVPLNQNGSTYLDDVAYYLYTNDIPQYAAADGKQIVATYTIGFMGNDASNAFLKNTSNLGNGISDPNDPEYGTFHFEAEDPDELSSELLDAISNIISETSTFTAPVVPVTRTTSGDYIYMAFFKPQKTGNFWQGNVTKFGIALDANGQIQIFDKDNNLATWPNGAIKDGAIPYWTTLDWATPGKTNYMDNQVRTIYAGNIATEFTVANMTAAMLGSPSSVTVNGTPVTGVEKVVNYIRGADVLDEDGDLDTTENRSFITGDILHSEPAVIEYDNAISTDTFVFYGSNDGMLHAVRDSDGKELWAFIPSDLLPKLKDILEGAEHQYFVDGTPKVSITGGDGDGVVEAGETAILVCGERRGGAYYFALDITNPLLPNYLWNMCNSGCTIDVGGELGDTWSDPVFGVVNNGGNNENALIVGGGYSSTNAKGRAVIIYSMDSGAVVKWDNSTTTGMNYSIPSTVKAVDVDNNGVIDKIYVGDLGGQVWRFGNFSDAGGPMPFPNTNEDITTWNAQVLFDATNVRKIHYPPAFTMEKGFDMVFFGTGDRDDACNQATSDRIYAVVDDHSVTTSNPTMVEADLVDVTDPLAALPTLPSDNGFFLALNTGEKILAEPIVFYKVLYATTFTPHDPSSASYDPCMPGGVGTLYALKYLTGEGVVDFTGDTVADRSTTIGGGIPSKPVMVIPPEGAPRIFISVGSTEADAADLVSEEFGAGTLTIDPDLPTNNFFYLWWIEP